ncbi:major facilitator superfamily domain-containing protein [Lipomyces japonicus]|uniref:major facilitator superfamily domain-containing protein n=1 Tax=Lipomyces japonicus TaxID=56871 RepID=UPI0034CE84A0
MADQHSESHLQRRAVDRDSNSTVDVEDIVGPESALLEKKGSYGAADTFFNGEVDHEGHIEALLAEGKPAWTEEEEEIIRNKLDYRVMILACIMFFSLQLIRNNIQNAISADFLLLAGITQNEYNLGQTVFLIFFLLFEIPSQALVRRFGADVWLPVIMTCWGVVSIFQIFIRGTPLFLFTRAIIGACEGGFVPGLSFWISSFYKSNELGLRYSWVWATQSGTNVIGALLASAIIQLGGKGSLNGWQWLFLVEGIISAIIGIASFFVMPSLRHKVVSRVFTARETAILKIRVVLEDPSKKNQQVTVKFSGSGLLGSVKQVYESFTDKYLLPIFLLGFIAFVPAQTSNYYLTITLRQLGFSQTVTNLLTIPYAILNISYTVGFSKLSDKYGVRWIFAILSALWVLPNLILLEVLPDAASRWLRYTFITLLLGYPYYHPILISWISANSNNPDRRSMAFAIYNICVQCGNILAANVYTEDDAPFYRRGNGVLIGINIASMIWVLLIRQYYTHENKRRERVWDELSEEDKVEYIKTSKGLGNQQLNFKLKI